MTPQATQATSFRLPASPRPPVGARHRLVLPLLAAILLLAGCGDTSSWVVSEPEAQAQLFLAPAQVEMENYTTRPLELRMVYPDGRVAPVTGSVAWTSSSPAVASVNESGQISARLPGVTTVTAMTHRGSATASVRVLPTTADLRLVVDDSVRIPAGLEGGMLMTARVVDVTGAPVSGVQVDFAILEGEASVSPARLYSDGQGFVRTTFSAGTVAGEVLAEVSSPGLLASGAPAPALSPGNSGGHNGGGSEWLRKFIRARVAPASPASVSVVPSQLLLQVGEENVPDVEVRDAFGNIISSPSITWSTSDGSIVSVHHIHGRLRGRAPGGATVTARATDDSGQAAEGSVSVTVAGSGAATLQIAGGNDQSAVVDSSLPSPLAVRVVDGSGAGISGANIAWAVVEGSATLSSTSSVSTSDGTSTVSVRLGTQSGSVRVRATSGSTSPVTFNLQASPGAVHSVSTSPASTTLQEGQNRLISAAARDRFGNHVPGASFSWSTSNPKAVSVGSDGRVSAVAQGSATITARSGSIEGSSQITVAQVQEPDHDDDGSNGGDDGNEGDGATEPVSLHIAANGSTTLTSLGQTLQLQASARDSNGNPVDLPPHSWTSSNTNVASVNSTGRVTAGAVGAAVISLAAACCGTEQVSISVNQQIASLDVSPGSASLDVGGTRQFVAVARDALGNPVSGATVQWSSSNTGVASVAGNGTVSALGGGSAAIRASSSGVTGQGMVYVSSAMPPPSGEGLYPNEPAGWRVYREQEWHSLRDNSGATWASALVVGGEFRLGVSDPTAPDGSGVVAEVFFPAGMADGSDPGRVVTRTPENRRDIFIGDYIKFSSNFSWHSLGIKMLLFNVHDQGWVTMGGGGYGFEEMSGTPPPNMSIGSRTGGSIRTSDPLIRGEVFPFNRAAPPAYVRGQWMRREFLFRMNTPGQRDGIARMWIDGVLVTEYTDVDWGLTAPDWGLVSYGMTWGGGGSAVPHDQTIRIAHFRMSAPP